MTPAEQRIAIAQACGWVMMPIGLMKRGDEWAVPFSKYGHSCIPDYLNDLNAMHEAEKVLTPNQRFEYLVELGGELQEMSTDDSWNSTHATAAQRAEAFLRTLNLGRFT